MLFYFTGTGNSRYIANRIAGVTGDAVVDMVNKIKSEETAPVLCDDRLIFVLPTYAWRIPKAVENWIRAVDFRGAGRAWFVMSCGSEIGNAAKYNERLCMEKGLICMGTAAVVMPENYIAMFKVPDKTEANKIIEAADPVIEKISAMLKNGQSFPALRNTFYGSLMSGAVNPMFYRFSAKAKAFRTDDKCIGCGKCARLCPLNTIRLEKGKPVWRGDCTHCMACISHCPVKAIEYGKKSVGKPRYHID